VTSSVTWLFDTVYAISYRCPIVTECLSIIDLPNPGFTYNGGWCLATKYTNRVKGKMDQRSVRQKEGTRWNVTVSGTDTVPAWQRQHHPPVSSDPENQSIIHWTSDHCFDPIPVTNTIDHSTSTSDHCSNPESTSWVNIKPVLARWAHTHTSNSDSNRSNRAKVGQCPETGHGGRKKKKQASYWGHKQTWRWP